MNKFMKIAKERSINGCRNHEGGPFGAVIVDKEGNIIDSIYRDVNRYFERCFLPKSDIIGKRASEIFPESLPVFTHFMSIT